MDREEAVAGKGMVPPLAPYCFLVQGRPPVLALPLLHIVAWELQAAAAMSILSPIIVNYL
jgi:hypothetical protein